MNTTNEQGAILFDCAKLKPYDDPNTYGVDALWNQFHRHESDDHAKAYTFTRGTDSVTVTFKTFYKLMSRYRNCASKYNSYDVPMYSEEQIKAGVHGRLWLKMDDNGKTMCICLDQPYLGQTVHRIPDERDKLAPAPLPASITLPCGWYAESALRHALQLPSKQITAVCFTTEDGHQVLIDKKILADFLRPAKGMQLEYRLKLDSEAYQMDAGTQSTYDGNKAITLKPLPASLRIEYRSQGYKGVARLGDSHLPPPAPSAVLTVSVPAVAHYTVAPRAAYQQPTLLDVVEEPAPIPIPEPATIPSDSDRAPVSESEPETIASDSDRLMSDLIAPVTPAPSTYAVAHKLFCEAWDAHDAIRDLWKAHNEPGEFPNRYDTLMYHSELRCTRRMAARAAAKGEQPTRPWYWLDDWEAPAPWEQAITDYWTSTEPETVRTWTPEELAANDALFHDAPQSPVPSTHAETRPHAPSPLRCPHTQPQRAFWKRQHATRSGDSDRTVAPPAGDRVRRAVHGPRPPPGRSRRHTCQCQTRTIGPVQVTVRRHRA